MERGFWTRIAIWAGFLLVVAALGFGVYRYGFSQALSQIKARGMSDLALAEDRLNAQLRRYQELAVMTADHPSLSELLEGGSRQKAQDFLRSAADKTGALGLSYYDVSGRLLADSFRGAQDIGFDTPWATRARQGALGTGHGVLSDLGKRAYFFAAPDFGTDGRVRAVLQVVVDIDDVEFGWRSSRPAVFFTDKTGEIFISNRSELLFGQIDAGKAQVRFANGVTQPIGESAWGGEQLWALDWGPYIPSRALHLVQELPVIGMRAEALIDVAPAEQLARLQAAVFAAVCVAFGAILFLVTERRHTLLLANRLLESRVERRTRELKRAQADLVQAGKLSALGQMSAGISHELNQPLMAIQQFAENGVRFLERGNAEVAGDNLNRISALSVRASRIIKNLRAFARNESEPMGRVDLVQVLNTSVELTEARLRDEGVKLVWQPPVEAVYALGGEVRLAQVFVNLINNAADAMVGQSRQKQITITLEAGARLCVHLSDTGPGIADPEKIFEPFYSTKEVGTAEGMGLGLSISYGLVQSFGGKIGGRNGEDGEGAVFTVELERWEGNAP